MSVNKDGLSVIGKIDSTSGSIGGFTITSANLYSNNILMGSVVDSSDNSLHSLLAVGTLTDTGFLATAQMYDGTVAATYGVFDTINTNYLYVSENLEVDYFRAKSIRAPRSVSISTGFYFGYSAGNVYYYAKITTSGANITITIYDSSDNKIALTESKSFKVYYACIWGKDTSATITVKAGNSSAKYDTNAFWGISYATFDSSLSNKSYKTQSFLIEGADASKVITFLGHLVPYYNHQYDIGSEAYRVENIYLHTSPNVESDKNQKNSILSITDNINYEKLFDKLIPVSFKYNHNSSDRTHLGFIAQDLKDAIINAGLTTKDVAAYCEYTDLNGNVMCGIRYEELIALCVNEIQKLKNRIALLENKGE